MKHVFLNRHRRKDADMDCIFCKIANGEIPSATIYEDEDFRVILDLGPATRGHSLILPKKHFESLFELPEELAAKSICLAKKLLPKYKVGLGCDGIQLVQNNGEAAGQTVFHYHLHMIPAYKSDAPGAKWTPGNLSDKDKEDIVKALKK